MKQLIIFTTFILAFSTSITSQKNIDKILTKVQNNNTTLVSIQEKVGAIKLGNKTDVFLQNPEVEFSYLWGNPSEIGNRLDFSIVQSFDYPTVYRYKKLISNLKNEQVEFEYSRQFKLITYQTRLICIELTYYNALKSELEKRLVHSQSIMNAYKIKLEVGDANILDYNKAKLNLLNIDSELKSISIEKEALLSSLALLNGGHKLEFNDSIFEPIKQILDFEEWYLLTEQNNPLLIWLKQELEINNAEMKLSHANNLPKFKGGYTSEYVANQNLHGINLGFSIPLWENKNKVNFAKANIKTTESITTDKKLQFYNQLKSLHTKLNILQSNINNYRLNLSLIDNTKLLEKALNKGEISLIYYLLELSLYYESINKVLRMEKELNKTLAEMNKYM